LCGILHRFQAKFHFFPFYREGDRSDEMALTGLSKYLGGLTLPLEVCQSASLGELMERVGQCDFFIGVRYHAILLAVQTGVPILGISYAHKAWRFMTENGLGDFVLPLEDVTSIRLSRTWAQMMARRDEIKEKLAAINARQKELAARHFELIARALGE
jgi:polysaccharide pyruvyl transferase WcaK-like protein